MSAREPDRGRSESGASELHPGGGKSAEGAFVDNIAHFARALRAAGFPAGAGQVVEAVRAVEAAGVSNREDFYWTLHACFVSKREHRQLFAQIFRLFWRDPEYFERMMALLRPLVRGAQEERKAEAAARRAGEALLNGTNRGGMPEPPEDGEPLVDIDASSTVSAAERLRSLDFEQMSSEEMAEARRIISEIRLPVRPAPSRRKRRNPKGRFPDWRATTRTASGTGGEIRDVARRSSRERLPNLVAICDISGSMSAYSRTLLHFLHSVANRAGEGWAKVHAFTFGTRLTNISRQLALADVDSALAAAGSEADDWEGGTRIGQCLRTFNLEWSRRVMGQGAVVLLISDGLESGGPDVLEREIERLRLSSRFLMWVNPLLRWESFAPKARGIRAMLPHVDCFRSGHSIESLSALADAVSRPHDTGEKARLMEALRSPA